MTLNDPNTPMWAPSPVQGARTRITAFASYARSISGQALASYPDLHKWSIEEPAQFWQAVWDFCESSERLASACSWMAKPCPVHDGSRMRG